MAERPTEIEMSTKSGGEEDAREEPAAHKTNADGNYWQTADCHRVSFFWVAISWQSLMLILYALVTDYPDLAKVRSSPSTFVKHHLVRSLVCDVCNTISHTRRGQASRKCSILCPCGNFHRYLICTNSTPTNYAGKQH